MTRKHISKDGQLRDCDAPTPEDCRVVGPNGGTPEHFRDQKHFESVMIERFGVLNSTTKRKRVREHNVSAVARTNATAPVLTEEEKTLHNEHIQLVQDLVNERAKNNDHIIEDANPERAKRRLQEAISYADGKGNEELVGHLRAARVLPSGAFRNSEGERFSTDSQIRLKTIQKHIEGERIRAMEALREAVQDGGIRRGDKFSFKDASGSYSMTVQEKFDQKAFDELPADIQQKIMQPRRVFSTEMARQNLSASDFALVTNQTQVINYVIGKTPPNHEADVATRVDTDFEGDSPHAKVQNGLQKIAGFYSAMQKEHGGGAKRVREQLSAGDSGIKEVAAGSKEPVFAPARSQMNGALVTTRPMIDRAAVERFIPRDMWHRIEEDRPTPDPALAAQLLSEEEYNRVFKAPTLALRVTEK